MPSGGNTTIGRASGQNNTYFDEIALIIKKTVCIQTQEL